MPDMQTVELRAERRLGYGRAGRDRRGRDWVRRAAIVSLAIHLVALAFLLFVRGRPTPLPPPPQEPGFDMVFQGPPTTKAVPNPARVVQMPNGETSPQALAVPPPSPPPPDQQAEPAPEVNVMPPEYAMREPPPSLPEEEPAPAPQPQAHAPRTRRQTAPRSNPFAHPMVLSFAPQAPSTPSRGLRNSRSLDLSMAAVVHGGQLREAVPHVASPGADGDYLAALSGYVETHKFYPETAAQNGEDGVSIVSATITRDGRVKDVKLVASSGSRMLDLAWLSLFRDHRLPPFPDDMRENQRDFTLSMDYELIRR